MNSKNALITGASRGLGLALAQALAQQGWHLIVNGRNSDVLQQAADKLSEMTTATAVAGDIAQVDTQVALANAAAAAGGLHLLLNNASILGPSPQPPVADYPLDTLAQVFQVNVVAQLGVLQAVLPHLQPEATIINVTSDAGIEAYPGWGGYGASKAALEQITAVFAAENPHLHVYWVDPGDMRTQLHQEAFPGEDISDRPLPEVSVPGFMALIEDGLPNGRYQAQRLAAVGAS